MKKPVKIYNLSSRLSSVNLFADQDIHIHNSEVRVDNLLNLKNKDEFSIINLKNKEVLEKWDYSRLYLGKIYLNNIKCCIFLQNKSNLVSIVNPNFDIKISHNDILHLILMSDSQDIFNFDCKKLAYKIYNDQKIIYLFGSKKFQHHIWLKPSSNKICFSNNRNNYKLKIIFKKSTSINNYYIRNVKLIPKSVDF